MMIQTPITPYFKKEVDIPWDEADNCYGECLSEINVPKKIYSVTVALEKLSDSILQKYSKSKNTSLASAQQEYTECSKCKKIFKNKLSLRTHTYFCGKERNLQCAHCPYKTGRKKSLIVHLSRIHPSGKNIQQSEIANNVKFSRICKKCKQISEALCPSKCEKCFNELLYQCNTCAKQFETHSSAYYHWDTRCGVKGYYNCIKCDFKSVWRSKVVKHMKQSHQVSESSQEFEKIQWAGLSHNIKESLEFSPYQCSQCTKIMKNSYALSRHILLCGGPKRDKNSDMVLEDSKDFIRNRQVEPIKCSKCGEKFDHIYSLNKHVRYCQKIPGVVRIIGDNKIEIAELNKDLMQISSIPLDKRHEKAREMAVKYCYKCEEETAIEKIRKIDRKSLCHKCNSTLLFKCQKCFNVYSKYRSVIHHLNSICNSQEEFKCLQCNYTARNISYVRNHSRSVHGTSNIECQKCKRKFKSTDYLRKHMRVCGLKPKFQCDDCPFKSKLKLYLRKHIFRSHMEPIVIDRRESVIISKQRFSRAMIHLKAHCSQCNKEQRLSDRLKNCRTCKKTLCYKCKTCNNNYTGDDENACNHVKGYLEAIKYECKRCGRGAISEKSLWMHEHNICGVKPTFGCRFCKYISNRKGDTIQHEKKKHSYKF